MSSVHTINPKADVISSVHALAANISAAKSLMQVLQTNLGPNGTLKMLVGGAGQIKLTKDGNVLLREMQIQHPTAALIARTAVAQDDVTGDGTTSVVILAGELLRQSERYVAEGCHPRILTEGLELARDEALKYLDEFKTDVTVKKGSGKGKNSDLDRELLCSVARTSLRTKLAPELADHLVDIIVDAVLTVRGSNKAREDMSQNKKLEVEEKEEMEFDKEDIDLKMVEIMVMTHKSEFDTKLVRGLVLDHGARHPNMAKRSENCKILVANFSLEWEKTEVNSAFFWSNAEQREKLVAAERKHVNDKVVKIIELKNKVCADGKTSFVLVNQQGIDPISLDLLQKEGIIGIRRAKRRNMERIPLACGGYAVNSENDLTPDCLGEAGVVYEHTLGEDKFTFIEDVKNAFSCTILIRGPNQHSIEQVKDAIRDGLRAVKNVIIDGSVIDGAGCFEANTFMHLQKFKDEKVKGRKKLGVEAFAQAMLAIPRILANNAGYDQQELLLKLLDATKQGKRVGLDLATGDVMDPKQSGVYDNYCVKKQFIHLGSIIAEKLLLVDEIMRAGRAMGKN